MFSSAILRTTRSQLYCLALLIGILCPAILGSLNSPALTHTHPTPTIPSHPTHNIYSPNNLPTTYTTTSPPQSKPQQPSLKHIYGNRIATTAPTVTNHPQSTNPWGLTALLPLLATRLTRRDRLKPSPTKPPSSPSHHKADLYNDPVVGRWPSRDPIGERGGVNLYGFVGNDALSRTDILGLDFGDMWHQIDKFRNLADSVIDKMDEGATEIAKVIILSEISKHFDEIERIADERCSSAKAEMSFIAKTVKASKNVSRTVGEYEVIYTHFINGIPVWRKRLGDIDISLEAAIEVEADIWYTCCCEEEDENKYSPHLKRIDFTAEFKGNSVFDFLPKGGKKRTVKEGFNRNVNIEPLEYKTPCDEK